MERRGNGRKLEKRWEEERKRVDRKRKREAERKEGRKFYCSRERKSPHEKQHKQE